MMIKERLWTFWNRYFSFKGRISRRAFWLRLFGSYIIVVLTIIVWIFFFAFLIEPALFSAFGWDPTQRQAGLALRESTFNSVGMAILVFWMLLLISSFVRRLHDIDRSVWWFAFFYFGPILVAHAINLLGRFNGDIPGYLILILVILMIPGMIYCLEILFRRGTKGSNRYGPDPLDPTSANA